MKYKVTEYYSDFQEEQTGTCELCFGTSWVENGSITVEDENGTETEIYLTVWDWGVTTQSILIMWLISQLGCKKRKLTQLLKKPNLGRGCMNW